MSAPLHTILDQVRQAPIPAGFRSAGPMRDRSMAPRYDAPTGGDPRAPQDQDEIHTAAGSHGTFACTEHRFETFSAAFGTRVAFHGPKGGEHG